MQTVGGLPFNSHTRFRAPSFPFSNASFATRVSIYHYGDPLPIRILFRHRPHPLTSSINQLPLRRRPLLPLMRSQAEPLHFLRAGILLNYTIKYPIITHNNSASHPTTYVGVCSYKPWFASTSNWKSYNAVVVSRKGNQIHPPKINFIAHQPPEPI